MSWLVLADVVVLFHFAFILFAAFGAWLLLRWRWIAFLQLPAAAWGFYVEASGRMCPLTSVENILRERAGRAGYRDDFLQHYVLATIYPEGLTRSIQLELAAVVVVMNVGIYAWLLVRRRRQSS